jgi:hypothetical protein
MAPKILLSEIVTEAINHNPYASPEQVLDGIVSIMEKEVLPLVIRDLSLPDFPSWAKMTIELKGRKAKKKFRPKETLKEKRAIIQQVEYLKKLNWDGINTSAPSIHFSDHDDLMGIPQLGMSFEIEPKRRRPRAKVPAIESAHRPYASIPFALERKNPFVLSSEIQEKIISDSRFEGLFKNVEVSVRKLIETRNLEAYLNVFSKSDLEIPTWEKYVITINLPSRMSFEERMKIWEIFDLTIRSKIADLAKKADEKTREYLDNMNKKLFVHMEL